MPVYEYTGVNAAGKKVKGVFDAENPRLLRDTLRSQGVFITEFFEGAAARPKKKGEVEVNLPWANRVSMRDVAIMTRQLATLQRAGIPLVESLNALVEQTENEALKKVISDVRQKVNEGLALAVAMGDHPKVFSPLYVNMIRAGESSGTLDVVLLRLADFLENQMALQAKVVGAMVYPILMAVVGGAIVTFLMTFVVPQVTQIFEDQGESLPFITNVLIFISHVMANYWWLLIGLGWAAIHGFRRWVKTPEGRLRWDRFTLRVPILGPLERMIAVSRFSRTLGTLLASGVPLLGALDIVKNILGNTVLIETVELARLNIREGESIAGPLKRSGEFPPMMTHMIAVGEKTGALEQMLDNVSEAYDLEVSSRITAMTSLLEPLMIVVMGGAVAFIVFAILLPILQLNQSVGG